MKLTEIEFVNIHKSFVNREKSVPVLNGISGIVEKGKILTIIGPSGSGKSTILSLCNLMLTADKGEIFIQGKEVREWEIQELRRYVGIAFQSAPMIKGTVLDNLSLPSRLQGLTVEDPTKFLQYVGLSEDLQLREAADLSGGQRQRLSLARTLVNNPAILLLDEITSALDPRAAAEVEELILRINREYDTTILWVTHDLMQAERVSDQIWFIKDGQLVEDAATMEFFSNPQDPMTIEFLEMSRDRR